MLTREERAKLRCEYSYPAHPASRLVTSLLDHADEQDAIIAQLREALEEAEPIICRYVCGGPSHSPLCEKIEAALGEEVMP